MGQIASASRANGTPGNTNHVEDNIFNIALPGRFVWPMGRGRVRDNRLRLLVYVLRRLSKIMIWLFHQ